MACHQGGGRTHCMHVCGGGVRVDSLAILANKIVLVLVGLITLRMQVGLSPYRVISAIKSAIFSVVLAMAPLAALIYFMHFDNIFILTPLYIALYLAVIYWLEKQLILMLLKNLR